MIQVRLINTNTENNLSLGNEESCVAIGIDLMKGLKWDSIITSQQLDFSTDCNLNKHKETMPKDPMFQLDDTFNQHKRKETAQCVSSFVIFTIVCFWLLPVTCSQTLHKEHGSVSIGVTLLELFGFMVFVWAVATMILAGAKLTRMHTVPCSSFGPF